MKKDKIPFKIGMQYENWEFNLDILPDRIKGLDSYLNIDESLNKFLNVHPNKTELLFSLDILEGVILTFENKTSDFYRHLEEMIFSEVEVFGEQNMRGLLKCEDYLFTQGHGIIFKDRIIHLFYCRKPLLQSILNTIINK